MRQSLTAKIIGLFILIVGTAELTVFGFQSWRYHTEQKSLLIEQFDQLVGAELSNLMPALWEVNPDRVIASVTRLQDVKFLRGLAVFSDTGELIASFGDYKSPPSDPAYIRDLPVTLNDQGTLKTVGQLTVVAQDDQIWNNLREFFHFNGIIFSSLFVALVAAAMLSNRFFILRPLTLLKQSIDANQQTKNVKEVVWNSADEIGTVVRAFNTLASSQAAAQLALADANFNLERRVSERTAELEANIKKQKETEKELVEARVEAETATEAKAEFLAMMSHEIRTPMGGVMSMAEILDQTRLSMDQKSMTRTIRQSAQALMTVINDILDFSKIEAGKLDFEHIAFDIVDVVQSTADLLAPRADEAALDLFVDIDLDLPKTLLGDPVRIRQILLNLGGNAIKFTSEGYVEFKVRLMARNGGARVRIEVTDTGIGLTNEQKGKLFQAFSQADSSTSRRFGGTGLGLSICRRLCEMMGGAIEVETEPGVGSTFWFELPLDVAEDASHMPAEDLSEASVMLVGYGSREASILRRYLDHGGVGCIVEVFNNLSPLPRLADALDHLERKPTLIMMNGKPGLHGIRNELLVLDGNDATRDVPMVISAPYGLASTLTARSLSGTKLKLLSTITAPQHVERLWHLVAVALGKAELAQDAATDEAVAVAYRPPPLDEARQSNAVVLVAEDNETNQIVIRRILSRLGFAFEIADDGVKALSMYHDRSFAMLLTDFHMPNMDGFELTAAIRAFEAANTARGRLPIVALTADALPRTEQQCLEAGMDGYLRKPIEMARIEAVLAEHLAHALELRIPDEGDHDTWKTEEESQNLLMALSSVELEVFDPAYLEESFGSFDRTAAKFLLNFVDGLGDNIDNLASAMAAEDYEEVQHLAHTMKGSANSVGASRLGRIMSDVEDAIVANTPDVAGLFVQLAPETLDELAEAIAPVRDHLAA